MVTTRSLGDERQGLATGIDMLRAAAEAVEHGGWQALTQLDECVDFLLYRLIPHLRAHGEVLYPQVERAMGAPGATAAMSRDHEEIIRLTREIVTLRDTLAGTPTRQERRALQRALYGLHAIAHLHLAKQEELYLPVIDSAMTKEEAERLFTRLREEADRFARE
jgi:iron-sulfur cluster repair protein YtfE (RIC family)